MKTFPKTIYVTRSDEEPDDVTEYYVDIEKNRIANEEEEDTEVAVYQLVKVGAVKKSSRIVFDKED